MKNMLIGLGLVVFVGINAFAQGGAPQSMVRNQNAQPPNTQEAASGYKLGAGDKLRVTVFGETDLGGEYEVDGTGYVRLPLIGQVQAGGLSARDFETQVKTELDAGYLRDARVSVEITNYRPFYILGEVNKPGVYPYVNDMLIINAVVLAGGYTYRANNSKIYIRRNGASAEEEITADPTKETNLGNLKVNPGDVIRVPERFF